MLLPGLWMTGTVHEWQELDGHQWQIRGSGEDPLVTDEREQNRGRCAPGMVAVAGAMRSLPDDALEYLQDATCVDWQPKAFPGRCLRFDEARWRVLVAGVPTVPLSFCIDRFEYPNERGAYPVIAVTWHEARALCSEQRKRLCTEDEWTFACEGEEALPYPYGFARDDAACPIDRVSPAFDGGALARRDSKRYGDELERLWRGETSGAYARCRSVYGVHDLTGNVDEWTTSTRPTGYRSILKGGYWGRVRTRCRPSTRAHAETFSFYQQGFRCCSD
jgi:hypothetical protein